MRIISPYRHTVRLKLNGFRMKVPVIFVEHSEVPRIMGREGIFSRFGIIFDEARRRVGESRILTS